MQISFLDEKKEYSSGIGAWETRWSIMVITLDVTLIKWSGFERYPRHFTLTVPSINISVHCELNLVTFGADFNIISNRFSIHQNYT